MIRFSITKSVFLLIALSIFNLLMMHYSIMEVNYVRFVDALRYLQPVLPTLFDILAISIVASVLSLGKFKIWACIVYLSSLFWGISNIVYSRFFSTYLSLSALGQVTNICDGFYLSYIRTAFRYSDLLLIIGIFLFILIMKLCVSTKLSLCTFKFLLYSFFVSIVLLFLAGSLSASFRQGQFALFQYNSLEAIKKEASSWNNNFIFKHGVLQGQIGYYTLTRLHKKNLTSEEIRQIQSFIKRNPHVYFDNDSIVPHHKNLIFILVESYLSVTSDLVVDGFEITPNLNRLRHLDNTYYNGKVKSNIASGESSDGQFIYMTGLLPRRSSITIDDVGENRLWALPSLLKKSNINMKTYMTIPTAPFVWRQAEMSMKYGIDSLLSINTSYMVDDKTVFGLASLVKNDSSLFHMILTMSMHSPYDNYIGPNYDIAFPENYSPEYRNYLKACHYTDGQLGEYIDYLRQQGIYDNSLIVIAADHPAASWFLKMQPHELDKEYIPLYILNVDCMVDSLYCGEINQLDVYPSILDAYGCSSDWQGLGCSIFNFEHFYNSVTEEAYEISDLIIEGDFFSKDIQ